MTGAVAICWVSAQVLLVHPAAMSVYEPRVPLWLNSTEFHSALFPLWLNTTELHPAWFPLWLNSTGFHLALGSTLAEFLRVSLSLVPTLAECHRVSWTKVSHDIASSYTEFRSAWFLEGTRQERSFLSRRDKLWFTVDVCLMMHNYYTHNCQRRRAALQWSPQM